MLDAIFSLCMCLSCETRTYMCTITIASRMHIAEHERTVYGLLIMCCLSLRLQSSHSLTFITRLPSLTDSCHLTPFTHSVTAVSCHHSTPSTRSDCRHVDSGCQLLAALLTTVSFTVCVNPFSHRCPVHFESTFCFETHLVSHL